MALIYVYSGTPGSGKSAHLASDIRFQLNRRQPRLVLANFDLAPDAPVKQRETFAYVPNARLDAHDVAYTCQKWWETHDFKEESIWLCIDECQMLRCSLTLVSGSRRETSAWSGWSCSASRASTGFA